MHTKLISQIDSDGIITEKARGIDRVAKSSGTNEDAFVVKGEHSFLISPHQRQVKLFSNDRLVESP